MIISSGCHMKKVDIGVHHMWSSGLDAKTRSLVLWQLIDIGTSVTVKQSGLDTHTGFRNLLAGSTRKMVDTYHRWPGQHDAHSYWYILN